MCDFETWWTRDTRTGRLSRGSAILLAVGGLAMALALCVGIAASAIASVVSG